jgi:MFS family permease
LSVHSQAPRKAGAAQGITLVTVAFLPIVAIVSMFPAVPAIIDHFAARDPAAIAKVPAMVSAPGLTIALLALFAGLLVDKFGRRKLLLVSTALYGFVGVAPFFLTRLTRSMPRALPLAWQRPQS